MHSLQGKGDTYEVVDVLTQVKVFALRYVCFREFCFNGDLKVIKTSVARDGYRAVYCAFDVNCNSVVGYKSIDFQVSVEDF